MYAYFQSKHIFLNSKEFKSKIQKDQNIFVKYFEKM